MLVSQIQVYQEGPFFRPMLASSKVSELLFQRRSRATDSEVLEADLLSASKNSGSVDLKEESVEERVSTKYCIVIEENKIIS